MSRIPISVADRIGIELKTLPHHSTEEGLAMNYKPPIIYLYGTLFTLRACKIQLEDALSDTDGWDTL